MALHTMHLNLESAARMKQGIKKIEARLNDEKRQELKAGDTIQFIDANEHPLLKVEVIKLLQYTSFNDMINDYDSREYFGRRRKDLLTRLRTIYPPEDDQHYGVLGIMVKVLDD
jgi:ASC-1-like (ASCH) protein